MFSLIYDNDKNLCALFKHAPTAKVGTIHTLFQADTLQACLDEMERVGVARPVDLTPFLSVGDYTPPPAVSVDELKVKLDASYAGFSVQGKAVFGAAYDAVVAHIDRGDIDAAKLAIAMIQIPIVVPGVSSDELDKWKLKKLEILGLFPA